MNTFETWLVRLAPESKPKASTKAAFRVTVHIVFIFRFVTSLTTARAGFAILSLHFGIGCSISFFGLLD